MTRKPPSIQLLRLHLLGLSTVHPPFSPCPFHQDFLSLGNLSSMMAVVAGLQKNSVSRLDQTLQDVPAALQKALKQMIADMSAEKR